MFTFITLGGDVVPDTGDVFIAGQSIKRFPKKARFSLGVCPQFTAIDSQLTVKEHLQIYGRLKGLGKGAVLHDNVRSLLGATGLLSYADRLASKLSGGNQRKLSLAIALMGKFFLSRSSVLFMFYRQSFCYTHRRIFDWRRCENEARHVDNTEKCRSGEGGCDYDPYVLRRLRQPTSTNMSPFSDSMEEASALANKVGILAKRMLGEFIALLPDHVLIYL